MRKQALIRVKMGKKANKRIREKEGVSNIIGTLLIFAILVGLHAAAQTSLVPVWNKKVEYDHLDVVYNDMMLLKSDIKDAGLLGSPKSSEIHLGVRYPERMMFTNPGEGAVGTLTVESGVKIVVEYAFNISGELILIPPLTYNSSRIVYEPQGAINSPKFVYEHGIIIRDFGTSNVTTEEQSLIDVEKNDIYIPVVNVSWNSRSKSSMGMESLVIYPYTITPTRTRLEYVNITMDTEYPEIWKRLFNNPDTDTDVNTTCINASVSGDKIIINHTAPMELNFPAGATAEVINAGVITVIATKQNHPFIMDMTIESVNTTYSNITATVKNATAPFDIHADLTDLTYNPAQYDVPPDYSFNESYPINAASWNLPNNVTVRWIDINHSAVTYKKNDPAVVGFRVCNSENEMEYYTLKTFIRGGGTFW
jgi:hypothetical protein